MMLGDSFLTGMTIESSGIIERDNQSIIASGTDRQALRGLQVLQVLRAVACRTSRTCSTCRTNEDPQYLPVHMAVRREDVPVCRPPDLTVHSRDEASGFLHDQRTRPRVPRVQVLFPEGLHSPSGNPAEVDGRRAQTPNCASVL